MSIIIIISIFLEYTTSFSVIHTHLCKLVVYTVQYLINITQNIESQTHSLYSWWDVYTTIYFFPKHCCSLSAGVKYIGIVPLCM